MQKATILMFVMGFIFFAFGTMFAVFGVPASPTGAVVVDVGLVSTTQTSVVGYISVALGVASMIFAFVSATKKHR